MNETQNKDLNSVIQSLFTELEKEDIYSFFNWYYFVLTTYDQKTIIRKINIFHEQIKYLSKNWNKNSRDNFFICDIGNCFEDHLFTNDIYDFRSFILNFLGKMLDIVVVNNEYKHSWHAILINQHNQQKHVKEFLTKIFTIDYGEWEKILEIEENIYRKRSNLRNIINVFPNKYPKYRTIKSINWIFDVALEGYTEKEKEVIDVYLLIKYFWTLKQPDNQSSDEASKMFIANNFFSEYEDFYPVFWSERKFKRKVKEILNKKTPKNIDVISLMSVKCDVNLYVDWFKDLFEPMKDTRKKVAHFLFPLIGLVLTVIMGLLNYFK